MHDLDRSDLVFEANAFDAGMEELDDHEVEPEAEEGVFDEVEQAELAGELLAVTDDQELDRFLGRLFKKAKKALGGPLAKQLAGLAKGALKTAGPMIATAYGGPAAGMLASNAGKMLGLELEGLSPEDQEFEAAKQLVRLTGSAIENAANAPPSAPPEAIARQAMIDAARRHAPGLLRRGAPTTASREGQQRGTWVRRGNKLIVFLGD